MRRFTTETPSSQSPRRVNQNEPPPKVSSARQVSFCCQCVPLSRLTWHWENTLFVRTPFGSDCNRNDRMLCIQPKRRQRLRQRSLSSGGAFHIWTAAACAALALFVIENDSNSLHSVKAPPESSTAQANSELTYRKNSSATADNADTIGSEILLIRPRVDLPLASKSPIPTPAPKAIIKTVPGLFLL